MAAWQEYKKINISNGGKHYLHRPYLRKSTVDGIKAGRAEDGTYFDANTGAEIQGTPDIGHIFGKEFWRMRNMAESKGWTQSEFNDYMNNPEFYQFENLHSNRLHQFERK